MYMPNRRRKIVEDKENLAMPENCIEWLITTRCNYNCSYCATSSLQNKNYNTNSYSFLNKFPKFFPGEWHYLLTGSGEPFVTSDFLNLTRNLVDGGYKISVVTNFSAPLKEILKFCEITGEKLVAMRASLHLEYVRPADFLKKALRVQSVIGDKLKVRSVATEGKIEQLVKIGQTFRNQGINFHLQLREKGGGDKVSYIDYSTKEMDKIKGFNKRFFDKNELKLKGKLCWAGSKYLILVGNGDIWRCWPALIHKDREGGYLGNIVKDTFKLKKGPTICSYEYCNCFFPLISGIVISK